MEETSKQPPVDREKLLIGLECCRNSYHCKGCTYFSSPKASCIHMISDALAYICYLEEQLGVTCL